MRVPFFDADSWPLPPPAAAWDEIRTHDEPDADGLVEWNTTKRTGADLALARDMAIDTVLEANDEEAARRIAVLSGLPDARAQTPTERMFAKQINMLMETAGMLDAAISLPPEMGPARVQLREFRARVKALREAEKIRAEEIRATGTATTAWP